MQREALAIEITYRDRDQRLLLAHWKLAEHGWKNGASMFNVEAACGCWADFETLHTCRKHLDAWMWRVVDATAPRGPKKLVQ